MKEECTKAIVKCMKNTLGAAILLGSIRARKMKNDPSFSEKSTVGEIVKLATVISLDSKDRALELGGNVCMKLSKHVMNFRLAA